MGFEARLELALLRKKDGARLHIAPWSPLTLVREKGLSSMPYSLLHSDRMAEDGADVDRLAVGGREITLVCRISPGYLENGWRDRLVSFLIPGMEGWLYVDRGRETGDRRIGFHLAGADLEQESLYAPLTLTLKLFCSDPWFLGRELRMPVIEKQPLLSFPFTSIREGGVTSGYGVRRALLHPANPGDLPCGIRAELRVIEGRVVNPYLICGSERLTVLAEAKEGDRITVCTEPGRRQVLLNGETVPFDRDSSFFQIGCGRSLLIVSGADLGRIDGEISMIPRYLGA